jgi:plasmid stabilization system protein ParE
LEKSKPAVVFLPKAEKSIFKIFCYIAEKGHPERAEKFYNQLYEFGYSLNNFPDKYALCRHAVYKKKNLHCAVFEHNYIFVYKVVKTQLVIFNIIHGKRLK